MTNGVQQQGPLTSAHHITLSGGEQKGKLVVADEKHPTTMQHGLGLISWLLAFEHHGTFSQSVWALFLSPVPTV